MFMKSRKVFLKFKEKFVAYTFIAADNNLLLQTQQFYLNNKYFAQLDF